ncbi:hypothetical protein FKP32DRAFT_1585917 [Trametes sanguinea]|nr:hypothetical protein FKP32DRAFT_1585917 [Trametes sanguinea]
MAPRPGPLMPYPLDLFTVEGSATPSKHLLPQKRRCSPSPSCYDSPAKRRVKADGTDTVPLRARSPLSASSNSARFATSHFNALLQGPDSPAKRLDFATFSHDEDSTSRSENGTPRTPRRSPKRTTTPRPRRSPRLSTVQPISRSPQNHHAIVSEPIRIPRDVMPPNPQSIHYPGFDIHQDPYTVLPTSASHTSIIVHDDAVEHSLDEEFDKENRPPRRKRAKKTVDPATPDLPLIKAALLSASSTRAERLEDAKPVPLSPHPKHVCDYLSATRVTPKPCTLQSDGESIGPLAAITPGRTPLGKEQRKQMRRAMEEEVDDA